MSEHVPPGPPATPPPAGWYADPGVSGQLRFWDGRVWTDQVSVPQVMGAASAPATGPVTPLHVHHSTPTRSLGCGAIVGIVLLGLVLLFAVLVALGKLVGGGSTINDQTAITACRFYVTSRLQAPDSATFHELEATEGAEDEWTVTGAVDSRSTGGTTERTTFVCVISPGPDGAGLQLDRLRFNGPAAG